MKTQLMLAHVHGAWPFHAGMFWCFIALVLLILFVTLVVSGRSKDK